MCSLPTGHSYSDWVDALSTRPCGWTWRTPLNPLYASSDTNQPCSYIIVPRSAKADAPKTEKAIIVFVNAHNTEVSVFADGYIDDTIIMRKTETPSKKSWIVDRYCTDAAIAHTYNLLLTVRHRSLWTEIGIPWDPGKERGTACPNKLAHLWFRHYTVLLIHYEHYVNRLWIPEHILVCLKINTIELYISKWNCKIVIHPIAGY